MHYTKKLITNTFVIVFIFIYGLLFNQYFGNKGVFPMDSFAHYDTGYRILNGELPFKDFWVVSGPLVDFLQALIFSIFGYSWQAYLLHASIINAIFSVISYKLLINIGLKKKYAFFYSLCIATLAYPISGTPFADLHSTFFSICAIYFYFFALTSKNKIYWFFVPLLIFCGFLSKQVPAIYIFFSILIMMMYNFFLFNSEKKLKVFIILVLSSLICLLIFFNFLILNEIKFNDFFVQYVSYPQEIGNKRFTELNYQFKNLILDFKLIYFVFLIYFFIILFQFNQKKNFYLTNNFTIFLFSFLILISLIQNQLLTRNQTYIFFIIPVISSFAHAEAMKLKQTKKKLFINILIILSLFSVVKYNLEFNIKRKFHELSNVNFSNSINGQFLDSKLKGLKWITPDKQYKNNVIDELDKIKVILKILQQDKERKMLITNYSFFSVFLDESQFGISRWYPGDNSAFPWFRGKNTAFPSNDDDYFLNYKKFFISIIKKKKIDNIYVLFDVGEKNVTSYLPEDCITQEIKPELFIKFKINQNCKNKF